MAEKRTTKRKKPAPQVAKDSTTDAMRTLEAASKVYMALRDLPYDRQDQAIKMAIMVTRRWSATATYTT